MTNLKNVNIMSDTKYTAATKNQDELYFTPADSYVDSRITSVMNNVGSGYVTAKANNYIKFSTGLILQWGIINRGSSNVNWGATVTYWVPFTLECSVVCNSAGSTNPPQCGTYNETLTSVGIRATRDGGSASCQYIQWIAIGY